MYTQPCGVVNEGVRYIEVHADAAKALQPILGEGRLYSLVACMKYLIDAR